jgi:hypothetical protein
MRRPAAFAIATLASLTAFGWTVITYKAPARVESPRPPRLPANIRAQMADAERNPVRAVRLQDRWLRENPIDADGWYAMAMYRARAGNIAAAEQAWSEARQVTLKSGGPEPGGDRWVQLATIRAMACDRDGTIDALQHAAAMEPIHPGVFSAPVFAFLADDPQFVNIAGPSMTGPIPSDGQPPPAPPRGRPIRP